MTKQDTDMAEQTRVFLQAVLADLATLSAAVTAQQRTLPTPCSEYDVAALTNHIVGWLENFAGGFADDDGICPAADVSGVVVPADEAAERIRRAAARLDEAVRNGASDRPLTISGQGGMPGQMALSMILGEYIIHGWDLARATGQPWQPQSDAAAAARDFMSGMLGPEYRNPGSGFGAEVAVADTASELDRLVGFTGRDPDWSA